MNTTLELTGVALAALLSENLVLVTCMGIGTHEKSFTDPREAIRTGLCLTVVMLLGALGAWLINFLLLTRFGWEEFQVLAFSLLIPGLVAFLRDFLRGCVPELSRRVDDNLASNEGICRWFSLEDIASLEMPLSARYVMDHFCATWRHTDRTYVCLANAERAEILELWES